MLEEVGDDEGDGVGVGVGVRAASRHRPVGVCTSACVPALKENCCRGFVASHGATVTAEPRPGEPTVWRHHS